MINNCYYPFTNDLTSFGIILIPISKTVIPRPAGTKIAALSVTVEMIGANNSADTVKKEEPPSPIFSHLLSKLKFM